MKAKSPLDGKTYYFIDKCLPFGASISCSHFQAFSDAIAHIVKVLTGQDNLNYLDDYFFVDLCKKQCNQQVQVFLETCAKIKFPVSMEKTFWACQNLSFLRLGIDTIRQLITIPTEKVLRAKYLIIKMLKQKKKENNLKRVTEIVWLSQFSMQKCCSWQNIH